MDDRRLSSHTVWRTLLWANRPFARREESLHRAEHWTHRSPTLGGCLQPQIQTDWLPPEGGSAGHVLRKWVVGLSWRRGIFGGRSPLGLRMPPGPPSFAGAPAVRYGVARTPRCDSGGFLELTMSNCPRGRDMYIYQSQLSESGDGIQSRPMILRPSTRYYYRLPDRYAHHLRDATISGLGETLGCVDLKNSPPGYTIYCPIDLGIGLAPTRSGGIPCVHPISGKGGFLVFTRLLESLFPRTTR